MRWITEVMEDNAKKEQLEALKQLKTQFMENNEMPSRRNRIDMLTAPETAIWTAMQEVEQAGADPRLTDAVNLLQQARDKVADFVDGINAN